MISFFVALLLLRVRSRRLRIDLHVVRCRGTWLTAEVIGALLERRGAVGQESSLPVPVAIGEVSAMLDPVRVCAFLLSLAYALRRLGGSVVLTSLTSHEKRGGIAAPGLAGAVHALTALLEPRRRCRLGACRPLGRRA